MFMYEEKIFIKRLLEEVSGIRNELKEIKKAIETRSN